MSADLPSRSELTDFVPLAERAVSIDDAGLIRFRGNVDTATGDVGTITGFVRLPFEVLAARTITAAAETGLDVTVTAADFVAWADGSGPDPTRRDAHWLTPLPPLVGWRRVELVPDAAIRDVVRRGALLARDASTRSGQQALLEATVLTATSADDQVEVPLGPLSALTRMGFLPRDSQAAVDVAPGWIRVAAPYGSTFVSTGADPLNLLRLN